MTIVLEAGRLIDGRNTQPLHDHAIVVDGDRITAVGPANSLDYPANAQVLSWSTGTIVPGLIDLHAHPTYYFRRADAIGFSGPQFTDGLLALFGAWQLRQNLEAGVTTVRDVGSVHRLALDIELGRRKGFVRVPRVIGCGRLITPTGGHVHDRPGLTLEADGASGVQRAVREEIKAGAQFIKLAINGADFLEPVTELDAERMGRVTNGIDFSQEELDAAVTEAHRAGLRVSCHALAPISPEGDSGARRHDRTRHVYGGRGSASHRGRGDCLGAHDLPGGSRHPARQSREGRRPGQPQ